MPVSSNNEFTAWVIVQPIEKLDIWANLLTKPKADTSAVTFIFKGGFDLGAVELNLAVLENHVLRHDFRYA